MARLGIVKTAKQAKFSSVSTPTKKSKGPFGLSFSKLLFIVADLRLSKGQNKKKLSRVSF